MTLRSVLIGLLGAVLLAVVTFFNDMVMRGTFLIGNFLPVAVFGTLVLFLLAINPLLRKVSTRLALSGRELAVIVILLLFVCYLPGRGLLHYFTTSMIMPHHYERTNPAWQSEPAAVSPGDVRSWQDVMRRLTAEDAHHPAWVALRAAVGVKALKDIPPERVESDGEARRRLLAELNRAIEHTAFGLNAGNAAQLDLTPHVRELLSRDHATLSAKEVQTINRGIVDALLGDALVPHRLGPVDRAPARMLVDVSGDSTHALDGFVTGLAQGEESIPYSDIPWLAWKGPLLFWMPLIVTLCVMVTGLGLVLHRQWATHEHLPYPTVEFARTLLPDDSGGWSPVMRSRLFWIGLVTVLLIHMNNYACVWWPETLIPVKLDFNFRPLISLFPILERGNPWGLFGPSILFTAVGFAYFLSTDVSLSLGLAPFLYCTIVGVMAGYGVSVGGSMLTPTLQSSFYAGSYFGMFAVLIYTGRHYYLSVFRKGVGLRTPEAIEPSAAWGMRIFLLMVVFFVMQLCAVGVDWQLSVLYTLGMLIIFTVISRLLAEAGAFFVHSWFTPCVVLWAFMGPLAAGPTQLLILAMISGLLLIDPREAMMPFAMSGIYLADSVKLRIGKLAKWGLVALVVAFAVAVPVIIHLQYERGAILVADGWTAHSVPKYPYNVNAGMTQRLEAQGALDQAYDVSGWQRFTAMDVDPQFLTGFFCLFSMVLLFSFLRHRFAWWPLHPLIFLVLGTWQSRKLAFSFLLGYAIKSAVMRFGGAGLYRKLKPLMVGVIAGEMLAAVLSVIIGALYYAVEGKPPVSFLIMPT